MKKLVPNILSFSIIIAVLLSPTASFAQRRVVVRRPVAVRRPIVRNRLVVRRGHPIRRALPANVVVRAARVPVVVRAPLVYLPALAWTPTVVTLPAPERFVWQETEAVTREEEWVDTNFGIDKDGNALFLDLNGKAKLNFAEITFANGNVQVVDFNERTNGTGVYKLVDFPDVRHVMTVRILMLSESDETTMRVYLSKS